MKTNQEWVELLSKEWDVSHSTAKKMLHCLHEIKEMTERAKKFRESGSQTLDVEPELEK